MEIASLVSRIISQQIPCYFISPHLDDAVLSCGGLLSHLAGKTPVSIVTVFSAADTGAQTLSAKRFLKYCGYSDAEHLFTARRNEDALVCRYAGAKSYHLGFIDGTWRKKQSVTPLFRPLKNLLPEVTHLYPTYWHISQGKVHTDDVSTKRAIQTALTSYLPETDRVVFAPLGLGNHVDHIIVRDVCTETFPELVYWADFPYSTRHQVETRFIQSQRLLPFSWEIEVAKKEHLIRGYKTQADALFPGGKIPLVSETYYTRKSVTSTLT